MSVASILLLQQVNKQLKGIERQEAEPANNQPIIINGNIQKVDLENRIITVEGKGSDSNCLEWIKNKS